MTQYEYRMSMGLCQCGEKNAPGRTRCYRCLQIESAKAKERAKNMTDSEKEKRKKYLKEYMKRPEQQARIKERGKYYQRRYMGRNLYEGGYPWEKD